MTRQLLFPNLRAEMARKGNTIEDIGKVVGISYSTIKARFAGRSDWTLGEVETLCDYFKKDFYELFERGV